MGETYSGQTMLTLFEIKKMEKKALTD